MAPQIDREIAKVNLPTLANPDFSITTPLDDEPTGVQEGSGLAKAPLTVSDAPAQQAPAEVAPSDLTAPKSAAMTTAQLQRLVAQLQADSKEQQFAQGMNMVDNSRMAMLATSAACQGLLQALNDAITRSGASTTAGEALAVLALMEQAEDPSKVDYSNASPAAKALIEVFKAQIADKTVTAASLTEAVLQRAWGDKGMDVTNAQFAKDVATLQAELESLTKDMASGTASADAAIAAAQAGIAAAQTAVTASESQAAAAEKALTEATAQVDEANGKAQEAQTARDAAAQALEAAKQDPEADVSAEEQALAEAEQALSDAKAAQETAQTGYLQASRAYTEASVAKANATKALVQAEASLVEGQNARSQAVSMVLQVFCDSMKAILEAMADYTESVKERNDATAQVNQEKARISDDLRKELLALLQQNEELADELEEVLVKIANGIVNFQTQLAGINQNSAAIEREMHNERMV